MRTFTHLNLHWRDRIEAMIDENIPHVEIAKILGIHKSTVSREVKRRQKKDGTYSATVAEHKALVKRENSKYQGMKIERHPALRKYIISELKHFQSPECIAGKMKEESVAPRVSSDAIYRWLRSSMGQRYCKYLCTKRYRKKPHSENPTRHTIPNMTSIHRMPLDLGWIAEGDTFLSPKKARKTAAVLVGWRESKLLKGDLVQSLRPKHTTRVMKKITSEYTLDALVLDQGIENKEHEQFGMLTYFCDKASPRQKPFIESSIGLLRRWFWPKGTDLSKISKEEFHEKLEIINNKYRKTLHYRSANEKSREYGIL